MIPNSLPKSLADNPRLDRWMRFADGKVFVCTGKVELGQGVLTALVQIAAEELDVEPGRIVLRAGATRTGPNEAYTAGSASMEVGGAALRAVSAEIRHIFAEHVALQFGVPAEALSIEDGSFVADGQSVATYWSEAAAVDLARDARGRPDTKPRRAYRIVGFDLPRIDLPAKVAGPAFIHDVVLPDMVHARTLRHSLRGARLSSDPVVPARFAGRVELVRAGDFAALLSSDESAVQECAALMADRLEWSGGERIPDDAGEPEWLRRQPSAPSERQIGEPMAGQQVVSTYASHYWRPYLAHGSIGPSCALAQVSADGRLTVLTHSQGVFPLRAALAKALGLDAGLIDIEHRQGAGCYGHNGADDAAFDAAFLALYTGGRPVRLLWTRRDEFTSSPVGAAMSIDLAADLGADNRPLGWTISVWSPPHGQRPGMSGGVNLLGAEAIPNALPPVIPLDVPDEMGAGAMRNAVALYDLPQKLVSHFVPVLPVRTSSLRGLGALGNVFAIESFVDELAGLADEDPVAFRLSLLKDPRAHRVVGVVAKMSGWEALRRDNAGGVGVAFSRYKNHAAYMAVVVEVSVDETVRVRRVWCAVDAGLVINPDGARNQIEGGVVQATSWALHEEVRFADGENAVRGWADYPVLRFSEAPEVEVMLVDAADEQPLGVGEVALGPTAAAIGNAVAMALGQRIRRLPFSRGRLVEAMA